MSQTVTRSPVLSAMIAIVGPPTYPAPMQQIDPLKSSIDEVETLFYDLERAGPARPLVVAKSLQHKMHNDFWFRLRLLTFGALMCFASPIFFENRSGLFGTWFSTLGSSCLMSHTARSQQLPLEHGLLPEAFIWANNHYDFGVGIGQMFRSQIHERIASDISLQRLIEFCKVHARLRCFER